MMSFFSRTEREPIPKLHESYTTYLYLAFAVVFAVLMVLGFTVFW